MKKIKKGNLTELWNENRKIYQAEYEPWIAAGKALFNFLNDGMMCFAGVDRAQEKSQALLTAKILNHFLSSNSLLEQGMLLDASLSSRNHLETVLLALWLLFEEEEKDCKKWLSGTQFRPVTIRKNLERFGWGLVRGNLVEYSEEDEENRKVYSFLSAVTHANVGSALFVEQTRNQQTIEIFVGGSNYSRGLRRHRDIILLNLEVNTIALHQYAGMVCHILAQDHTQHRKEDLDEIQRLINYAGSQQRTNLWPVIMK